MDYISALFLIVLVGLTIFFVSRDRKLLLMLGNDLLYRINLSDNHVTEYIGHYKENGYNPQNLRWSIIILGEKWYIDKHFNGRYDPTFHTRNTVTKLEFQLLEPITSDIFKILNKK